MTAAAGPSLNSDLVTETLTQAHFWSRWAEQWPADCWLSFAISGLVRAECDITLSEDEIAMERVKVLAFVMLAERERLDKRQEGLEPVVIDAEGRPQPASSA